jgi:hypothetical protein
LNVNSTISLPCDAAISEEGKIERIDHWMNNMWKVREVPTFQFIGNSSSSKAWKRKTGKNVSEKSKRRRCRNGAKNPNSFTNYV